MALARLSTPAGLATLLGSIPVTPTSGTPTTIANWKGHPTGSTPPPTHYRAPKFNLGGAANSAAQPLQFTPPLGVAVDPTRLKYMGKLQQASKVEAARRQIMITQRADEGSGNSYYLAPGIYETNFQVDTGTFEEMVRDNPDVARNMANFFVPWEKDEARIWVIVTTEIAQINKQAEEEHCADIVLAYSYTIGKVQTMLDTFVTQGGFPGTTASAFGSEADWMTDQAKCAAKFEAVLIKTSKRDSGGWHTFSIVKAEDSDRHGLNQFPLPDTYGTAPQRTYLKMATSGTTKIGTVRSAEVITI